MSVSTSREIRSRERANAVRAIGDPISGGVRPGAANFAPAMMPLVRVGAEVKVMRASLLPVPRLLPVEGHGDPLLIVRLPKVKVGLPLLLLRVTLRVP
jgi:hypothetical protein